jgi:hypothetical protein
VIIGTLQRIPALIRGEKRFSWPKEKYNIGPTPNCAAKDVASDCLIILGSFISLFSILLEKSTKESVAKKLIQKPSSLKNEGQIVSITSPVIIKIRAVCPTFPRLDAKKAIEPIMAALIIGASNPDIRTYNQIETAVNIKALRLPINKRHIPKTNPPTKLTFIPLATTTWAVPVEVSFSQKSFVRPSFDPNVIPATRAESFKGKEFL